MRRLWTWVRLAACIAFLLALAAWEAHAYTTAARRSSETDPAAQTLAVPPPQTADPTVDDELFWRGL